MRGMWVRVRGEVWRCVANVEYLVFFMGAQLAGSFDRILQM